MLNDQQATLRFASVITDQAYRFAKGAGCFGRSQRRPKKPPFPFPVSVSVWRSAAGWPVTSAATLRMNRRTRAAPRSA